MRVFFPGRSTGGFSVMETIIAAGLMSVLLLAMSTLQVDIASFTARTSRQASAHSVMVRFEKEMERTFYSNALHRFLPERTLIVDGGGTKFAGTGWIVYDDGDGNPLNNTVPRTGFPIATFTVNGQTFTQNSWLIERFRVHRRADGTYHKATTGFTTSRCVDRRRSKTSYTMAEVLALNVAVVRPNGYSCCPLNSPNCANRNPINELPTVFTVGQGGVATTIWPEAEERGEVPGLGFTLVFDGNPSESYRIYLLKITNQCTAGLAQVSKPCANTRLGAATEKNLNRDMRREVTTLFRSAVSGFTDSFFVRVGSDFDGQ